MAERSPAFDEPLTQLEAELLDIAIEECSEVIKEACKLRRFGRRPNQNGESYDNVASFSKEYGQLAYVMEQLRQRGLTEAKHIAGGSLEKERKLPAFLRSPGFAHLGYSRQSQEHKG